MQIKVPDGFMEITLSIPAWKGGIRMYEKITVQARTVVTELLDQASMKPGSLFVMHLRRVHGLYQISVLLWGRT